MVNRINKRGQDITPLGFYTEVICTQLKQFTHSKVLWVNRFCNKIADFICKQAIVDNCNSIFKLDYPENIYELVMKDLIN
ncbi:hypothetical protein Gohar_015052 [Gossypium harknessii]|uniref:RNase H type-1 domain-containing protein n=1 Tax=Gossypium harknessii TaxID=34285 RepID=A0A7J9G0P3_9ROSI|nr:hypothetical protein [Gossypium harknessii]